MILSTRLVEEFWRVWYLIAREEIVRHSIASQHQFDLGVTIERGTTYDRQRLARRGSAADNQIGLRCMVEFQPGVSEQMKHLHMLRI